MRWAEAVAAVLACAVALQLRASVEPPAPAAEQVLSEFHDAARAAFAAKRPDPGQLALSVEAELDVGDAAEARVLELLQNATSEACQRDVIRGMRFWAERSLLQPKPPAYKTACGSRAPAAKPPPLKPEEVTMAFVVFAYDSPRTVERLVRSLAHPNHFVLVHFDPRAPEDKFAELERLLAPLADKASVTLLSPRRPITEHGFALSHALIESLKLIIYGRPAGAKAHHQGWHFVSVLSEDHYPLQSHDALHEALADRSTVLLERAESSGIEPHFVVDCDGLLHQIGPLQHSVRPGMTLRRAARPWGVLSRDFVRFLTTPSEQMTSLVHDAQHWPESNSLFLPTALANSPECRAPGAATQANHAFTDGTSCDEGLPYCHKEPRLVTEGDLPLLEMGGALFGERFPKAETPEGKALRASIDAWRRPDFSPPPSLPTAIATADGSGCLSADGARLSFEPCAAASEAQQWLVGPCSSGGGAVVDAEGCLGGPAVCALRPAGREDQCVDLYRGDFSAGAEIGLWDCHKHYNQLWTFDNCSIAASAPQIASRLDEDSAGLCLTATKTGAVSYQCGKGPEEGAAAFRAR